MTLSRVLPILTTIATLSVGTAHAEVVLNFAGLNGNAQEAPLDYYNGGTGSLGSGPGPNYGIVFSANALACSGQPTGVCNTAAIPGGPGANALFFLSGSADTMNVAAGFTTGFSFYYTAMPNPANVTVWDGLNGTGSLLATIELPVTATSTDPSCYATSFCPYVPIGVTFGGTARSVNFGGAADQVAFADITLGASTPGTGDVPEPASLALVGAGLIAMAKRRRK